MIKALIVYRTRYGATANTSEEIAQILRQEGLEVRVVDAKKEKVRDISEYELVTKYSFLTPRVSGNGQNNILA